MGLSPSAHNAMHELSIVEALVEQVGTELERAGQAGRVARIDLSIGRLSGVHCDSIRFAFGLLAPGTVMESADLVIDEPKAVCNCRTCGTKIEIDDLVVQCPRCNGDDITIEGGRDLVLHSIEVEE
jgi:hydrogenase nickel incorporation protein HypA/HybF